MKKFLSLLLAAVMLLSCVPAMANEFPALDKIAAWDFIGDWNGVSGLDVMGDPTTDYPELRLNLFLNGLGDFYLDGGKKEVVGWYIEDGSVLLARTVDKVPQADQVFAYAYKNETGRLVVDMGYCSVICEQEGEEYTDVTWPAFDAEDAKYFIGTWKSITYISGGEEIPAEMIGEMIFVLNDDGTAQSIEGTEEPYELRWYSDYAVAYLGETPTELVEITFDGNGNISVKMDAETTIIMAPFVENGTILGKWERSDRTVEIYEDGKLKLIYKEDGYISNMQWEVVDGTPTVTLGTWSGSAIHFEEGYLIIDDPAQQKLTRVGLAPDLYVGPGGFAVAEEEITESFPALDAEAAAPFCGDWHAVAGKDVMGDFTNEYPVVNATLNADGTATVILDGVEMPSGWYVEAEYAFLAAVENGKPDVAATYAMANIDEDGRLVIDFFYAAAICEQDGVEYAASARPETPWPELDLSNGQYFVGVWHTADGSMTLTLNDDGTASSEEPGEEPYALRWYADYGIAYVGETVNEAAKVTFDGSGNIVMEMGDQQVVLVPYVEELTTPVVEDPSDLVDTWNEISGMGTLVVNADGTAVMNYSDGTVYELPWQQTVTGGEFTGGMWYGASMELQLDGSLSVDNGWMTFVREGEEYVGGADDYSEYELPEAQPIGAEGEPYFGTWTMDMGGMAMNLTLNQDGTCTMEIFGEVEPGVWTMVDGKANVMGDELYIDGDGNLVMESQGMVFVKSEGEVSSDEMTEEEQLLALLELLAQMEEAENGGEDAAVEEEDFYIGRKFVMTGAVISGINLSADQLNAPNDYVIFNADGSVELFMGDRLVETLGWTRGSMNIAGQEYEGFIVDYYGTIYNFGIAPYGLAFDYFGTVRNYEPEGGMPSEETETAAEPEVSAETEAPDAMFNSYEDYMDIKFVAKTYTTFGTVQDASTLGAEYAVTFHADGTCEFVMAGINTPGLTWGLQEVAMGLNRTDAFVINYYGVNYNCIPTGTGFDMDFYGTMNLHFVPAE